MAGTCQLGSGEFTAEIDWDNFKIEVIKRRRFSISQEHFIKVEYLAAELMSDDSISSCCKTLNYFSFGSALQLPGVAIKDNICSYSRACMLPAIYMFSIFIL